MWNYIQYDKEGERVSDALPERNTACLAYDAYRGRVMLGFRERGGYLSFLEPNCDDDCLWLAWAPLSETSEPDMEQIRAACAYEHYLSPCYSIEETINLLRQTP